MKHLEKIKSGFYKHLKTISMIIIVISIFPMIMGFYQIEIFRNFIWINEILHTFSESIGAIISIIIAIVITIKNQNILKDKDGLLSLGFFSMGILNGFHSIVPPGTPFVFLHSIGTLLGGFFFSLIIFPKILKIHITINQIIYLIIFLISIGVVSLGFPDVLPIMVHNNNFTIISYIINFTAGFLFLISSICLFVDYYRNPRNDVFLFAILSLLFSISSLYFKQSSLWDGGWWVWHILKLSAFIIAFIIVVQQYLYDIKQIRNTQKQLKIINDELQKDKKSLIEKNKELSHFTYIASHDLQEPLNTIFSYSSLLKDNDNYDKLDGLGKKCIKVIDSSVLRMKELVIGLLVYSRIGKNNKLELVNINEILDEIKIDLDKIIKENDVKFIIGDLLQIKAYRTDIRMLFSNLITNSIKYRKETEKPIINIEVTENTSEYIYSITDNGIGIDMVYKDKIFEVFQRLHTKEQYSGTGIGLANCYRIVELHNGKIWVNSEVNSGSKFSFTINKKIINNK